MPLNIHMACDQPGCRTVQPANFDSTHETFGSLLQAYRSLGWNLLVVGERVLVSLCPVNHDRLATAASELTAAAGNLADFCPTPSTPVASEETREGHGAGGDLQTGSGLAGMKQT